MPECHPYLDEKKQAPSLDDMIKSSEVIFPGSLDGN